MFTACIKTFHKFNLIHEIASSGRTPEGIKCQTKNDELYLHPAAASEGGVGKQNVVWWLGCVGAGAGWFAGVCVCECEFLLEKPTLSRQGAMGKQTKEDHSKSEPQKTQHRWASAYRACPRNFICIFPLIFIITENSCCCYHR